MRTRPYIIDKKETLKQLYYTVIFNTIIALFLTYINFGMGFTVNFIFCQCIGLTISLFALIGRLIFKSPNLGLQVFIITIAIAIGSVAGTMLGSILAGLDIKIFLKEYSFLFIKIASLGILFGSIITYIFLSAERISFIKAGFQDERIKRLTGEKKLIETNLRILQAQIEPHFLFNTLSNILSLLDSDPEKGKRMLEDLINYLRISLIKTRRQTSTIQEEMEVIQTYLNIFKVRMGDRLRYKIDVPDEMKNLPFPPMLIQPLVENAIKHGLEPRIEGGELCIRVVDNGEFFRLEVADTGLGLYENSSPGLGLSNVRERLKSIYGGQAQLILEENHPTGLKAIIEVPYGKD